MTEKTIDRSHKYIVENKPKIVIGAELLDFIKGKEKQRKEKKKLKRKTNKKSNQGYNRFDPSNNQAPQRQQQGVVPMFSNYFPPSQGGGAILNRPQEYNLRPQSVGTKSMSISSGEKMTPSEREAIDRQLSISRAFNTDRDPQGDTSSTPSSSSVNVPTPLTSPSDEYDKPIKSTEEDELSNIFGGLGVDRGLKMDGITDTKATFEEPQEAMTGEGVLTTDNTSMPPQYEGVFTEAMSGESKTLSSENEHGGKHGEAEEGYTVIRRRRKTYTEQYTDIYGEQPPQGMSKELIKERVQSHKPQSKRKAKKQGVLTTLSA